MRRTRSLFSFAYAQLRARRGRAAALGAGILVAAVCFGLLSSETATSKLQVTATVKHNFRSAYDVLVRPNDAQTPFEKQHHVVDDGFLSGLFGGITMRQYRQIQSLPGVSLAAPVANVGYFMMSDTLFVPFPRSVTRTAHEVLRVNTSWNVHNGLEHVPGIPFYLYYTDGRLTFATEDYQHGVESVPGAPRPVDVCEGFAGGQLASQTGLANPGTTSHQAINLNATVKHPFRALDQTGNFGCSARHMMFSAGNQGILNGGGQAPYQGPVRFGAVVRFETPVLVAGIDPAAENRLVGLQAAMVFGRYLHEGQGLSAPRNLGGYAWNREYPVIASDRTYFDERADITVQRLRLPAWPRLAGLLASNRAFGVLIHARGPVIGRAGAGATSASTSWRRLLSSFNRTGGQELIGIFGGYYRVSPTHDAVTHDGVIVPQPVKPDGQVWVTPPDGPLGGRHSVAPPGADDTLYRSLSAHYQTGGEHPVDGHPTEAVPVPRLTGTFDPARLRGFSPLSTVPLQTFYPPTVTAANAAARSALGTRALGPTMNPAGYLTQPPLLLTTLQGAIALENGDGEMFNARVREGSHGPWKTIRVQAYQGVSPNAPISTIQVRVKGVTGPNQLSLARIKLVAENIARTTGLTVNITAGSSPTPETIHLAAGRLGAPALTVHQGWTKEDVDSAIINGLSHEDLELSLLVLVVCGLFVASATTASVRQRRREIAILSTVGWKARSIFALVVGEAALVGLIAGLIGCGLSVALAAAGSLQIPVGRLALVVPVTVALTMIAAAWPAWRAAHVPPMDALRDPVLSGGLTHQVRTANTMALANLLRVPGRTLVAIVTLIIGVGALALIIGVTLAFRGGVAGTLLGNVVSVSVRNVDLISSILIVLVGAAAVTDVMVVSLQERAAELATLRSLGWTERQIITLAGREGLMLGVTGSLLGAILGVILVAALGATTAPVILAAVIAVLGGVLVTTTALVLPLRRLGQAPLVTALATE
ncbi:MAG: FtsX-like permease family protein [Pseudonocardiaceae bacterium]